MRPTRAWVSSPIFVRIAWLLWLTTFLMAFAKPLLMLPVPWSPTQLLEPRWPAGWWPPPLLEPRWPAGWWAPPLLAIVLPTLLHAWLRRRIGGASKLVPAPDLPVNSYRLPVRSVVVVDERAVRRLALAFVARLASAMAIVFVALIDLQDTYFHDTSGCCVCHGPHWSVPEYLALAAMWLFAALWHAPTSRRVVGWPPPREAAYSAMGLLAAVAAPRFTWL